MKPIIVFLLCLVVFSFTHEKQYAMKFNQQEVIAIFQVVDQSGAPHTQVKAVQEILNRELKQYIDSTGKFK